MAAGHAGAGRAAGYGGRADRRPLSGARREARARPEPGMGL